MNQIQYANHIACVMNAHIVAHNSGTARFIFATLKDRYDNFISYKIDEQRRNSMKLNTKQRILLLKVIDSDENTTFTKEEQAELELLRAEIGKYKK